MGITTVKADIFPIPKIYFIGIGSQHLEYQKFSTLGYILEVMNNSSPNKEQGDSELFAPEWHYLIPLAF